MKITAEKTINAFRETRYHFVVHGPQFGKLSGTPGRSRSLNTWASKRSAIEAGRRNFGR